VSLVLILGLLLNLIALPIAGRRIWFLNRLIRSGQPAPDRVEGVTKRTGLALKTQVVEVFGQKKLLKWTVPGAAHFFVFWAFVILASVYLEAYGALFDPGFAIPFIGHWGVLGFLQDFIAVMALIGIATFTVIRIRQSPERLGRRSRFKGSHLGGAWLVLFMIFNVIWSMFLFRGSAVNTGNFPYGNAAFMSHAVGKLLEPLGESTNEVLENVGLLIHIGVMLTFLIIVLNSKHLHIFLAPLNVMFKRKDVALGDVKPLMVGGEPIDFENIEDLDEDASLGIGKIEDFSWKGMLDFATCTECGRCQSQCPAWNTEKPLSPKLLIMNLRDHAFAKAPYLLTDEPKRDSLSDAVKAEAERELVGATEGDPSVPTGGAVIDPDVLWSCTSCGACVQQCPVDIEHVDHIVDMRRYQVLIESNFPSELNQLFKGLETKGNPWNMSASARMDWAKDLPFEVKQVGSDIEDLDEVDWLFWVGCAGAYEDRAKKTTRAVAELLDMAGVSFAVLGDGETCTGDPARRAGNEFVFQQLAMQNAEVLTETKAKKVVSTCAHCFNTLKNEYAEFGVELEVVHHTQLLNRLVREGRLTPVAPSSNGTPARSITYHDPCFLGRHNQVYSPPRELLDIIPGSEFTEMPRNSERSFCCGAGGARMWMEENIGERINVNRTTEAVGTGADQIAVGCPFCRVMLSDGLTSLQADGKAREEVEVLDVAQMLLASVQRKDPAPPAEDDATKAEPEPGDTTQTDETVTEHEEVGADAKASAETQASAEAPEEAESPDEHQAPAEPPTPAQAQARVQAQAQTQTQTQTAVQTSHGSGGDGFSAAQRNEIDKAIRDAETLSRFEFSVFVGRSEGETRPFAERLHSTLVAPDRSVLVLVDPAARRLEIVTGSQAKLVLDDAEVKLAAMSMQTSFAAGDLVGGITRGLHQLAAHARRPQPRGQEDE
jgi:Fe-S oxidoreductase